MENTQSSNKHLVPKGLRIWWTLGAVILVALWLGASAIGGPYFGRIDEVSSNDRSTFLPTSAESTQVQERLGDFVDATAIPAIVVVTSETTLTAEQIVDVNQRVADLSKLDGLASAPSPAIPSADGLALQAFVPLSADAEIGPTVEQIRAALADDLPTGLVAHVTGPAGLSADLLDAFAGIDGLLLLVALSAVFVILLAVYRSALLPFMVILTAVSALCAALLTIWYLARADIVVLTGQTQGILFILVVGAATDYSLLYTSRFREELLRQPNRAAASVAAWKVSVEPIVASGGTVIVGLLCLLFSDLGTNKSLGPVAAIGIAFSVLAALTFLPALMLLAGKVAYWPRRLRPASSGLPVKLSLYEKVGSFIKPRPRQVWVVCVVLLAVGAGFVGQLRADGVSQTDLVLTASDARQGQNALAEHFPGSSGTPIYVLTSEGEAAKVAQVLLNHSDTALVSVTSKSSPSGSVPLSADNLGQILELQPTVSDGAVLLQLTISDKPDSQVAQAVVKDLRSELVGFAQIGGSTAITLDTNMTSLHDRNLIIPIVLFAILLMLMALLRSVLAPVLLVATTVLSFGTTMGISALLFNHVLKLPGADPTVPLYGFVFLVALGIDYNIFLMTRVREESLRHGTRQGVLRGLSLTGGVITSAGVVLAVTFAALAVIPILFLVQLAFIVAFGVLLDTFLVRTLLVPALALDIGPKIWWPSKLAKEIH